MTAQAVMETLTAVNEVSPRDPRGRFLKGTIPNKTGRFGVQSPIAREARDLARTLVDDDEYRERLRDRLIRGKLAPPVECLLWHYAYGRPRFEIGVIDETRDLSRLGPEQLRDALVEALERLGAVPGVVVEAETVPMLSAAPAAGGPDEPTESEPDR